MIKHDECIRVANAPLPIELKDRVDIFVTNATYSGEFQKMQSRIRQFSSFNAFVRAEIREGNI